MGKSVIIFDLDGTLTKPVLDFDAIRAEIGGIEGPILEAMVDLSPEDRARAELIVARRGDRESVHERLIDRVRMAFSPVRGRIQERVHVVEQCVQRFGFEPAVIDDPA